MHVKVVPILSTSVIVSEIARCDRLAISCNLLPWSLHTKTPGLKMNKCYASFLLPRMTLWEAACDVKPEGLWTLKNCLVCPNCSSVCRFHKALERAFLVLSLCLSLPMDGGKSPEDPPDCWVDFCGFCCTSKTSKKCYYPAEFKLSTACGCRLYFT